jgi:NTP pyrophosphatase (non-canonical NTP hydrolase)
LPDDIQTYRAAGIEKVYIITGRWKDFYAVSVVETAGGRVLELSECQRLMARIYGERDAARGAERTLLWMLSEAGEVADAYIKDSKNIGPEFADLLAWMLSTCNVLGIDIQKEFISRYGAGCPRCGQIPCRCPAR